MKKVGSSNFCDRDTHGLPLSEYVEAVFRDVFVSNFSTRLINKLLSHSGTSVSDAVEALGL